jgi:2-keto-4-pentenoate hydratase/2-oxohepta-3-ene-1,7-dioic acid hydratase in catechol pathway
MRFIRFQSGDKIHLGQPIDQKTAHRIEGSLLGEWRLTSDIVSIERLLAPLEPADILCIGLNYREHANESQSLPPQNPMLFIKSGNTLNHPGSIIPLPKLSSQIDYEGELAVVIGKAAIRSPTM